MASSQDASNLCKSILCKFVLYKFEILSYKYVKINFRQVSCSLTTSRLIFYFSLAQQLLLLSRRSGQIKEVECRGHSDSGEKRGLNDRILKKNPTIKASNRQIFNLWFFALPTHDLVRQPWLTFLGQTTCLDLSVWFFAIKAKFSFKIAIIIQIFDMGLNLSLFSRLI